MPRKEQKCFITKSKALHLLGKSEYGELVEKQLTRSRYLMTEFTEGSQVSQRSVKGKKVRRLRDD